MMAWKYYSTIIQIRIANAGGAGEESVGQGVTLTGKNGRNQTVTADECNHGEFGGDTTIIDCTIVIASGFFYFLPIQIMIYSNIFECPCNGLNDNTQHMLPKWNATTSHILYYLLEQSSSSHIVNKYEQPS
jgi:hypothetical protein